MNPTSSPSDDEGSDPGETLNKDPIYVDHNGQPVYCIHMVETTIPGVVSFLIPESMDEKMQFVQEVCHVTRCEVLVFCNLQSGDNSALPSGSALSIPLGYYRHSGPKHYTRGQWMYKLQFWRGY